mgnify:CR=1 FL=1
MADWVKVARIEALPPGSRRVVDVDGVAVAVFNLDGEYCAIEDTCTHDGGELASGEVRGDEIVCPRKHFIESGVHHDLLDAPGMTGANSLCARLAPIILVNRAGGRLCGWRRGNGQACSILRLRAAPVSFKQQLTKMAQPHLFTCNL